MKSVYINKRRVVLDPSKSIGKGGEADVYDLGNSRALKIFKTPDHPDFLNDAAARDQAKTRIAEHQTKLSDFPAGLPQTIITPLELAYSKNNRVAGYSMRLITGATELIRYGDAGFRKLQSGDDVRKIFQSMHVTVNALHNAGVIIGDFNDLNILIKNLLAYFIDADSFQFGKYRCRMFTARFADPLLCNPKAKHLELAQPHTANSDWYAFAVMLMQSLLAVDPYGGVYRPKDKHERIPHDARPLKRITVFHPEVRYPKPAIPYNRLPDDLLQFFHKTFERDERGTFPPALLESLRWTKCSSCGAEHARNTCPVCAFAAPAAIQQTIRVRGKVTCNTIFKTRGIIMAFGSSAQKPAWVVYENGAYKRESGEIILQGTPDPDLRFQISGSKTIVTKQNNAIVLDSNSQPQTLSVDFIGKQACLSANEDSIFRCHSGSLWKSGTLGPEHWGDVLARQTRIWVGNKFGFGYYQAGRLSSGFVFSATHRGLNDQIKLPATPGQLIKQTAILSDNHCWFIRQYQQQGRLHENIVLLNSKGEILAEHSCSPGDPTWINNLQGPCATSSVLLVPTDDGIIRLEANSGAINIAKTYPDTEPFVDAACRLIPCAGGLALTNGREIRLLKIT